MKGIKSMLEVGKSYTKPELSEILHCNGNQALKRKLTSYKIEYSVTGRGERTIYTILKINAPFKLFAILELECGANTDFHKLKLFYWYYFNDETFRAMPDEVKENRLRMDDRNISRQTIANYTRKLENKELINRITPNYIYYFAYKGNQRIVEHAEYVQAWKEYWNGRKNGADSFEAIVTMRANYGGVARKQAIPEINGIYNAKIEYMLDLIQQEIEYEL